MNVRQAYQSFTSSHLAEVLGAPYAVESEEDAAILIIGEKSFNFIQFDMTTHEEKSTEIKFTDVKSFQHFVEIPENIPEITSRYRLFIRAARKKIQIACSEYDLAGILKVYTPPADDQVHENENEEEE